VQRKYRKCKEENRTGGEIKPHKGNKMKKRGRVNRRKIMARNLRKCGGKK
jgi:hypothetical protein